VREDCCRNCIIQPGATLGVLGSGQLGRMFAIAARRMGYRVHTLSPGVDTPTGQVADAKSKPTTTTDAIRALARGVTSSHSERTSTAAADAAPRS
jgi:5-(carboxyamino)imidazole ribonucleotide synthase